jgi:acetolactate synthase-1/2/3 large subunit
VPVLKGAEIIVDYLIAERVPYLFGLCGHGNLGFLDAVFDRQDRIRTVSVHHESAAGFMADAYYRVAQRPVATFTSSGPGSANMPVAIASALADSSAFLAITGNVPTSQFNRGPFQESGQHFQADFPSVMRPYVKRSFQATRPEQLPLMMRQAFATMLQGRPGPVHLDVPLNVFVETTDTEIPDPGAWRAGVTSRAGGDPEAVAAAAHLLLAAERPVIVAGHGVEIAGASGLLISFAESYGIPVAHTPLGTGVIDMHSPLSLGATGRNGTSTANQATRSADVILALGTRFDDRSTSAWLPGYTYRIPPTRLIHVDIDPQEIGRNYPPAIGIVGDAGRVLEQLHAVGLEQCGTTRQNNRLWLDQIANWKREWDEHIEPEAVSEMAPLHPARVVADLRAVLPEDGIILSDVGVHHNWLIQRWLAHGPRTVLQSWGFASMGFGVCGVLGAKLAAPEQPVVAVVGDGGFLMHPGIVATAVEYDIPVVWLVWNNIGYCSIRDQQLGYFGANREIATSFEHEASGALLSADFAAMARSMGAEGVTIERPEDLREQIAAAIGSNRPTVVDVRVARDVQPVATGSWDLPPLRHPEPTFGLAGLDAGG